MNKDVVVTVRISQETLDQLWNRRINSKETCSKVLRRAIKMFLSNTSGPHTPDTPDQSIPHIKMAKQIQESVDHKSPTSFFNLDYI